MNSAVASSSVISRMPCSRLARQPDEALDLLRHADQRVHRACRRLARDSCSAIEKARLGMNGNGCAGSMASGVSSGNTWVRKRSSSQARSAFLRSGAVDQHDAGLGQRRPQFQPALLLIAGELRHRLADAGELLVGGEPVRALGRDALAHLAFQAGDAHHEEFVEVVGRDRQEAHPLQQRMVSLAASSRTRRLKCSQDSSRLMKRCGCDRKAGSGADAVAEGRSSRSATGAISSTDAIACARSAIVMKA